MLSYLLVIVAYLQGAFKLKYKQKEKLKMTQRGKAVVNEKKKYAIIINRTEYFF